MDKTLVKRSNLRRKSRVINLVARSSGSKVVRVLTTTVKILKDSVKSMVSAGKK